MMILDATTRKLQAVLAGAITTNQLPIVVSWVDVHLTSSVPDTFVPGATPIVTNSTTAVDITAAPAAGTIRQIKTIHVYNADTVAATVTVRYNDNATLYTLVKVALPTLCHLVYTDTEGWEVLDSTGAVVRTQTLTLTGNVTGTGVGSIALTIPAATVTEAMQVLADNTTQDVSTSKHGYVPKAPNDTTKFLRGDGTFAVPGGGGLIAVTFLTAGTTFTTQALTTHVRWRMQGAGGGGGGAGTGTTYNAAGGGGAGAYLEVYATVTGSTGYTYAIGAAGTAGANTGGTGGTGGSTTLVIGATTYTAAGGVGGTGSNAGSTGGAGGAGGAATNGGLNITGQAGTAGVNAVQTDYDCSGGVGGSSGPYGQGGPGVRVGGVAQAVGKAASGYGGGGGGGVSIQVGGTGVLGGVGTAGLIIVEEY